MEKKSTGEKVSLVVGIVIAAIVLAGVVYMIFGKDSLQNQAMRRTSPVLLALGTGVFIVTTFFLVRFLRGGYTKKSKGTVGEYNWGLVARWILFAIAYILALGTCTGFSFGSL
jgi:hypothetical protein